MNAQEMIIGHVLPIAASVAVLWVAYRLLFSNSNRLKFNRMYLLTSLLFALALPLMGLFVGHEAPQVVTLKQNLFGGSMLSEIVVTPDGQPVMPDAPMVAETSKTHVSVWQILGGIYIIGVGLMTLLFLFKLGKLVALIIRSPKRKMSGYTAVFTGNEKGSFSFFRYAFFPDENVSPDIIRHEVSHISHRHSWDILFAEVMMILQWFNPFIYLYKKELQSLHEYQADRDVVATGIDKRNYMMLILQQCTAGDFSGMSNNFSLILTKKRIKMITKNEKAKGLWWRLLATLPVLAILLIANTKVTAQEKKAENQPFTIEIAGSFEIYDDDGFPIQLKDTVIYNEDGSYVKYVTSDDIDPETGKLTPKMTITTHKADGSSADYMNLNWDINDGVARYTDDDFSISADESLLIFLESLSTLGDKPENDSTFQVVKDELYRSLLDQAVNDTVFDIVDEMPEFPGGADALMQFVASGIKYPEDAVEAGKEGRVFVSFVVEKDGLVSNVKVLRGVCYSIDEEAARVVRGMPRWKPGMKDGKPARVSYQIPIMFKLDKMENKDKTTVKTVLVGDEEKGASCRTSTATYSDNPALDKMKPNADGVYQIVEEMPSFPGGDQKLMEYIANNINYPHEARDKGIEGRVFIRMVIEKDGSVSNVKLLRGIGGGCDEEAVRVISSMPKWKPGMQDGKPVRVSYQIPINFKLTEKQPKKK